MEEYVAALTAALHGPARVRARMVGDIRDGLVDTADAYAQEGMPPQDAAREAVRDFGPVGEIAASCQRELTVVQARHTARVVALTVPFLLACWYAIRAADPGLPPAAHLLGLQLAAVAATAAVFSSATLVVTGSLARRLPTPSRLPLAVAWTGTAAAVAAALATVTFAVTALFTANWTLLVLAGALAAAAHATIASSARACRRCAHLPVPEPNARS
ncbi:permease prefix domain 1-containing protein [Thermomonospora amylolytica]|uniref:permease prefix domain 1-containing protein n=1 Tax=Thermomonospora amylolytica TaxID=1411117 RepID=UPI000E6C6F72|nr:permease prefix domain 1-containing protein [Thermomonospora amylolytica]